MNVRKFYPANKNNKNKCPGLCPCRSSIDALLSHASAPLNVNSKTSRYISYLLLDQSYYIYLCVILFGIIAANVLNYFLTLLQLQESCLGLFSFHVDQCVDIFQRSTLLIWELKTHVVISASVLSTAAFSVMEEHQVAAETEESQTIHYQSDKVISQIR